MKLFVVLFAFLAVQASARIISNEADVVPDDILELVESSDLDLFGDFPQEVFDEFAGEETIANPEKCLPYVQDAYKTAVEVRRILNKARELRKKFREGLKKCRTLTKPDDTKKCIQDLRKQAVAEGKPLKDAYLKIRPRIIDLMGKFDKCMAGQAEGVAAPTDAKKCLPHVPEAYNTAVEVRRLIVKARELGKKLNEGLKKCRAMTKTEDKKKCFRELKKQAAAEGKPLKDAYLKIRPKIIEVMSKFDKCMA